MELSPNASMKEIRATVEEGASPFAPINPGKRGRGRCPNMRESVAVSTTTLAGGGAALEEEAS